MLAGVTGLGCDQLPEGARRLIEHGHLLLAQEREELINQDMKEYNEGGFAFTVSQIEVEDSHGILSRKDEFVAMLDANRERGGRLFSALLVTDITELSSLLIIAGEKGFEHTIGLPKQEDSVYIMRDVVSRKKQLMPILSEIVERYQER